MAWARAVNLLIVAVEPLMCLLEIRPALLGQASPAGLARNLQD